MDHHFAIFAYCIIDEEDLCLLQDEKMACGDLAFFESCRNVFQEENTMDEKKINFKNIIELLILRVMQIGLYDNNKSLFRENLQ